jgi:hypothetical protein
MRPASLLVEPYGRRRSARRQLLGSLHYRRMAPCPHPALSLVLFIGVRAGRAANETARFAVYTLNSVC